MNKRGQALAAFILVLPLLIVIGAFIVDSSYMTYKRLELKDISEDIIRFHFKKKELSINEIAVIYQKNNIPTDNLKTEISISSINLINTYELKPIFGKLAGFNSYEIRINITGEHKDNKIILKQE